MTATKPLRIVHLTSVHVWHDTRVFSRMCRSLAAAGFEVHLVAACQHKSPHEIHDGVHVHTVPRPGGRAARLWTTSRAVCRVATGLKGDIYHFHDPELIPFALWMVARGLRVIYDVHEDVPRDLMEKHWLKPPLNRWLAIPVDRIEQFAAGRFAAVVTAEDTLEERFRDHARRIITIHNYARLADFKIGELTNSNGQRSRSVVNFGGVSPLRAIRPIVEAFGLIPESLGARLIISGRCESDELLKSLAMLPGFRHVDYRGWQSHEQMRAILSQAAIAMVLFSRAPNHSHVRSNRFFESLAAAVPVITADFPNWKAIINEIGCGITVDPDKPHEIANAVQFLLSNPEEARRMGELGRQAIIDRFNWESEQQKLFSLYETLSCAR